MRTVFERRNKVRPGQDKPRDLSLDEVVEKLSGLNLDLQDIVGIPDKIEEYDGRTVNFKDFRISVPYHEDGKTKIRIIGMYTEKSEGIVGHSAQIDYVHTFN